MALPSSFLAGKTLADVLTGDVSIDFNDTTDGRFRCSLWESGETGSPTVDEETTTAAYGTDPWGTTTNYWAEFNTSGYTAGGGTPGYLSDPTMLSASGTRKVVWADGATSLLWTGLSGTESASGLLICHHNGSAYTRPIVWINFGGSFQQDGGEFEVAWDTTDGILSFAY
jgi:hypothetical protein